MFSTLTRNCSLTISELDIGGAKRRRKAPRIKRATRSARDKQGVKGFNAILDEVILSHSKGKKTL